MELWFNNERWVGRSGGHHADLDFRYHTHKHLVYICCILSRCLKKTDVQLIGKLLCSRVINNLFRC
jgi:hypothetical protein